MRTSRALAAALVALAASAASAAAEDEPPLPEGLGPATSVEPALPEGLGGSEEPELPEGLEGAEPEPALPEGLGAGTAPRDEEAPAEARWSAPFDWSGFVEGRLGTRTQRDPDERTASIGEARAQLKLERAGPGFALRATGDLLYDGVLDRHRVNLETGAGLFDLREAFVFARPSDFLDLKVGRQILTWGTGDLVFINDLFPKDWNSFFIGRDVEYLKAPSDALKASIFTPVANFDVVYTPRFDADRFIDGRRISFFNPALGAPSGREAPVRVDRPDKWFGDDEIAVRIYRTVGAVEVAGYYYHGFWKSPAGADPRTGKATFPALDVFGASARGPLLGGIAYAEGGLYLSKDMDGDDPFARNSELRALAGYEHEIARDLTLGVQYYVEWMMDYGDYRRSRLPTEPRRDEDRHVITVRLMQLLMQQNLALSLFAFASPSDRDAYFRPHVRYRIDDHWSAELGGNVFVGRDDRTFFGQFERNSNVYAGVRYAF